MIPEESDKLVRDLIARVYLPPDLFPSDPDAIEAMLAEASGQPLTDEQVERMLKKAKGELPVGEREDEETELSYEGQTEEELALFAFRNNESDELLPDIKEKLQHLGEKAKDEEGDKEADGNDELKS